MEVSVEGKIATVKGVPGHEGVWNGDLANGVSKRKDEFLYPDGAKGLATACASDKSQIAKEIWVYDQGTGLIFGKDTVQFDHPRFQDPSCRWRIKNDDGTFSDTPPMPLPPNPDKFLDYEQMTDEPQDRQSPETCQNFCGYLNRFFYKDCADVQTGPDGLLYCMREAYFYICTDEEVGAQGGASCAPGEQTPEWSNSRGCSGQDCRCQQDGQPHCPDTGENTYYSYYRRYEGTAERQTVETDKGADTAKIEASVACYGLYDEFDPKTTKTDAKDRRCVIGGNLNVSGMRESQTGKKEYGQNTKINDMDPMKKDNQRKKDDEAKDVWDLNLGWGISFVKEKIFEDEYEKDFGLLFQDIDNLDKANMRSVAPVQNKDEEPRLAKSSTLRAFDDTGMRVLSRWWQKQETEVATLSHPAVIRLLLPPGYAFGVDPNSPLVRTSSSSRSSQSNSAPGGDRGERIEIQIDADEDALGVLLRTIEDSALLHFREEPIPVVLPQGSPTEFRARAEQWCTWYMQQAGTRTCDDAPDGVKATIEKLLEYADTIERVRDVRAQLPLYAQKIAGLQNDLTEPIATWIRTNITAYKTYIGRQKQLTQDLGWQAVQQAMRQFTDKTNLPWCMNQRFETPIYSLLDDWLPSRTLDEKPTAIPGDGGRISGDDLPDLRFLPAGDIVIDFSHIAAMKDAIVIPVIKPVQVRLKIPVPFEGTKPEDVEDTLPDLPDMQAFADAFTEATERLPKVKKSTDIPPPFPLPRLDDAQVEQARGTIRQIGETIKKMNDEYAEFWESLAPLKPDDYNGDDINRIPEMRRQLYCKAWDTQPCIHVEMDLMERFQRINSRPMVLLQEDFESKGELRAHPQVCLPDDDVCLRLHPEEQPQTFLWQVNGPGKDIDTSKDLKQKLRDITLPKEIGTLDAEKAPPYDVNLNQLLPSLSVPAPIDLTPPKKP